MKYRVHGNWNMWHVSQFDCQFTFNNYSINHGVSKTTNIDVFILS